MQRREPYRVMERAANRLALLGFVLALALFSISCAGGSGSSGFDLAENEAIDMALDEQRCVESEGLTICPAGETTPAAPDTTATPSRTATPVPVVPTPTPTRDPADFPTGTPVTPPAQQTVTATPASTATARETPTPSPFPTADGTMNVDTSFDGTEGTSCLATDTPGICILPFVFMPQGFSVDTHYQVAVRDAADQPWELLDAVQISFDTLTSIFQSDIPIEVDGQASTATVILQTAVLVFVDQLPPLAAGEIIDRLSDSGAGFAFVNPEEALELVVQD